MKKKLYQDKKWLRRQYVGLKKSITDIQKEYQISRPTLSTWLNKFGIKIRSKSENLYIWHSKNKREYKDKQWLYKNYIKLQKSTMEIAKEQNVHYATITNHLKLFNITMRTQSECVHLANKNEITLSQRAKRFIDGEMLGDMSIKKNNKWTGMIKYSSKYKVYLQWLSKQLNKFKIKQGGHITKRSSDEGRIFRYESLSYPILLKLHNRWYPNGIKEVPENIKLTPIVCRQWLIGDGTKAYHSSRTRFAIILCTCSFSLKSIDILIKRLSRLGFMCRRIPSSNSIKIRTCSTKKFLRYIGKSPVKCYEYKWNT